MNTKMLWLIVAASSFAVFFVTRGPSPEVRCASLGYPEIQHYGGDVYCVRYYGVTRTVARLDLLEEGFNR